MNGTEDELMERLSNGDSSALRYLFDLYYPGLCQYAFTYLKDMDEAEDVAQSLFVETWERRNSLEIKQSIKQYLYKAVYFKCINAMEYKQVRKNYAEREALSPAVRENTEEEEEEKRLALYKALDKLPKKCKQVFLLSRFEDLKYAEIADKMGISKNTVENHMGKALRLLRTELKHLV